MVHLLQEGLGPRNHTSAVGARAARELPRWAGGSTRGNTVSLWECPSAALVCLWVLSGNFGFITGKTKFHEWVKLSSCSFIFIHTMVILNKPHPVCAQGLHYSFSALKLDRLRKSLAFQLAKSRASGQCGRCYHILSCTTGFAKAYIQQRVQKFTSGMGDFQEAGQRVWKWNLSVLQNRGSGSKTLPWVFIQSRSKLLVKKCSSSSHQRAFCSWLSSVGNFQEFGYSANRVSVWEWCFSAHRCVCCSDGFGEIIKRWVTKVNLVS